MIVREAFPADAATMTGVLNAIIRIGGTTAHQVEKTEAQVLADCISGPEALCCFVAEDAGAVIGFQGMGVYPALANGWGEIGTFVRPGVQRGGVGAALFAATVDWARSNGIRHIEATIRGDNAVGLGFYSRRGFVDIGFNPDYALKDGRVVGRVTKRFDVV